MAWIESHQTLREHPKTYRFMEILKISKPQAVGHLHLFWWWCVDYAPTGDLGVYSDTQLARASCWEGDSKAFVTALIDSKFLDRKDGVLTVHDWLDFCGDMMHKRIGRMEQKRQKMAEIGGQNLPTYPTKPTVPILPNQTNEQAFDLIWAKYPRKLGRKDALKHFLATVKSKKDFDRISFALDNYCRDIQKNQTEDRFIQHGSTWFNKWVDWEFYKPPVKAGSSESMDLIKQKWKEQGLSKCHGKPVVEGKCDYCLMSQ